MAHHRTALKWGYFAAGTGFGAVIGLLFAPRSGTETRQLIEEKTEDLLEKGREMTGGMREHAGQYVERAKQTVQQGKEQMREAIGAGKQAYQENRPSPRPEEPKTKPGGGPEQRTGPGTAASR